MAWAVIDCIIMCFSYMKIIDAHIHHYPEAVMQNPLLWAQESGEGYWASLVGPKSVQGFVSTGGLLAAMEGAKVDQAVLAGWYWERGETCEMHNAFYATLLKRYPGKFIAFASVQALDEKGGVEGLKRAIDGGFKGVGECFPALQGYSMQDPRWLAVVELAIDHCMPILLHVTEPLGHHYPGKLIHSFEPYAWLAKTYPEATLIFAHWGGLMPFYELNPAFAKTAKNIYYDTAASPLLYDRRIFQLVLDCVGPKKILYGSDFPLRLYPSKQKEPDFETFLDAIYQLQLPEEALKAILGGNMQGLLERVR